MMPTALRPPPSLAVPSTQNTAPVLDFRCLYTYDLRRKAKRWQDGLARFHTFNKRVMVYDEPRNFIGDTHWREPEPIQDGDELQLDKGILIQIGEATGKTDQDISGIFEKRKAAPIDENRSPARTERPHASAPILNIVTPAANSQLKPRTLNSLLGTPKGQLGRATLPSKSPYEVHKARGIENEGEGRSLKRQRISNLSASDTVATTASRSSVPGTASGPHMSRSLHRPASKETDRTLEKSDKQSIRPSHEPPIRPASSISQNEGQRRQALQESDPRNQRSLAPAMRKAPRPISKLSNGIIHPPKVIDVLSDGSQDHVNQGSRLRIVSSKPRKKLMYRDLIPQVRYTKDDSSEGLPIEHGDKVAARPVTSALDPLSQFHHEEQDRLKSRLEKHDLMRAPAPPVLDEAEIIDTEALTIVPDKISDVQADIQHDNDPSSSEIQGNHLPKISRPLMSNSTIDDDDMQFVAEEARPVDDPNSELTKMDAILLSRPQQPPQHMPSTKNRQIANPIRPPEPRTSVLPSPPSPRNRSRPSLPSNLEAKAPDQSVSIPQKPMTPPLPPQHGATLSRPFKRCLSAMAPATTTVTIQPAKRSLRKTVSDTGTLRSGAKAGTELAPVGAEPAPDPWSSEAWDLFGWRREDFAKRKMEREARDDD